MAVAWGRARSPVSRLSGDNTRGCVMRLYEKYRPKALADVIGQPKAVRTVERTLSNGAGGTAWWISGGTGTGKTSGEMIGGAA